MSRLISFLRWSVCLSSVCLLLGRPVAQAAGSATVVLDGATFGNGLDVHLNSGTTVLPAAASYDYVISGAVHGTGWLAALLPNGTQLSALLEQIQPGGSSVLSGTQLNPGGTLPFTIVDQTFSGTFPISAAFTATANVRLVGRMNALGRVRFHVVDVDFNVPGFPNLGTVVFEPGSTVVVSVKPVIEFVVAAASIPENLGTLMVRVRRKLNRSGFVTVHYSSAPITATASDFDAVAGDLTFAPGETVKILPVTIQNRAGAQGNRSFRVRLSAPEGGVLGLIRKEVVTITDVR